MGPPKLVQPRRRKVVRTSNARWRGWRLDGTGKRVSQACEAEMWGWSGEATSRGFRGRL
jgi:hypothetical protein